MISVSADVLRKNGLVGEMKKGEDPFFNIDDDNETGRLKKIFQQRFGVKYELELLLPYQSRSIAAASYNLHLEYFSKAFGIRMEGEKDTVWSGCVGFGLERWALAFLAQHGPEENGWPKDMLEHFDT